MASSSPRLSYLPSDVEEDLGIIDFDEPQYDFLGKAEFFLFEDIPADHPPVYDKSAAWLSSVFEPTNHDPYFDVQSVNTTPVNGLSRFDYLSRSEGRFNTATITRRKNDNVENEAPKTLTPQIGTRFGTITKRSIQLNDSTNGGTDSDRGNRTFEFPRKNGGNHRFTVSSSIYENTPPILTDPMGTRTVSVSSPNTNTITKNRRSYTVRQVNEQLNRFSQQQTEDETSVQSVATNDSSGSRNYPTISRNETRSIVHPQRYTNSNDDLAYDSSSAISVVSNLSMTSSVSQPSLPHSLSLAQLNNNSARKPMATRSGLFNNNNSSNMNGSRLCRPSSQNGIPSRQTTYTKLTSSGATFGSTGNGIGSMQQQQQQPLSNMARTSSQTTICEDSSSSSGISSTSSQLLSQLNSPALSRNSTFRVHRPSPIPSVATVFAAGASSTGGQPVATSVTNGPSNSSLKYSSGDKLHTSQEEIDQFRAKVLNSSNGNLRSIHAYQQGPPQPTNGNYQNRADSPSSNSSSGSSNSSTSRLRFAPNGNSMSLANRLNNNHHHYQTGSTESSNGGGLDAKAIGLKGYTSHNLNSSLASNNNNSSFDGFVAIGGERNGSSLSTTNSKSALSRIPAMPKATNTPNRSAIPVSGTISRPTGASHCEVLAKRTKLASAFPATSKLGPPQAHHLIANKLVDDNSWQNDCF